MLLTFCEGAQTFVDEQVIVSSFVNKPLSSVISFVERLLSFVSRSLSFVSTPFSL